MGPYPHPQHPLSRSAGLAIALYTPLLGLHLYRIQGITVIVITKLQLNRSATVVLETFRDIKGAAVLCVTLNRYDGVANWHAKDSASDIFSTTAKAWLAGWLTDTAYLDSHCPSCQWPPTITGWNSATEHISTYLILKVLLSLPPAHHGRQIAFVPCPGLSHILIRFGYYGQAHCYRRSWVSLYSIKYLRRERKKIDGPVVDRT